MPTVQKCYFLSLGRTNIVTIDHVDEVIGTLNLGLLKQESLSIYFLFYFPDDSIFPTSQTESQTDKNILLMIMIMAILTEQGHYVM